MEAINKHRNKKRIDWPQGTSHPVDIIVYKEVLAWEQIIKKVT